LIKFPRRHKPAALAQADFSSARSLKANEVSPRYQSPCKGNIDAFSLSFQGFSRRKQDAREDENTVTILVIDGQGGKLGKTLVENIKKSFPHLEIMAVGTNSAASDAMRRAGADRVATGENPVIVACRSAQIIVGPIGIAIADALMGEISPAMANAVASSNAYRVLIPMNLCSTYVAGVDKKSPAILDDAMAHIRSLLEGMENKP
jgi:hypothetical protein